MNREETLKIQVNGISGLCDIEWLNEEKPDYAGFVFYKNHNRITLEQAMYLRRNLDPAIHTVGIFTYASFWLISELLESKVIDAAHIEGDISYDEILQLRRMTDRPLIKTVMLEKPEDIAEAQRYPVDYLMYDCRKNSRMNPLYLEMLQDYGPQERKFFITDRLCEGFSMDVIRKVYPHGLTLDTFTESKGRRDIEKVRDMIRKIRM